MVVGFRGKETDSSWQVTHSAGVNVFVWCFWTARLLPQVEYQLIESCLQVLPHSSCGPSYLHEENHLWKDLVILNRRKEN